jgi:hypothetical protein
MTQHSTIQNVGHTLQTASMASSVIVLALHRIQCVASRQDSPGFAPAKTTTHLNIQTRDS